jgi:hypothetical protein
VCSPSRRRKFTADRLRALDRLTGPIQHVIAGWDAPRGVCARNAVLEGVHRRQSPYWEWEEDAWLELTGVQQTTDNRNARLHLVALGYLLGGHQRLHHRAGVVRVRILADLVFGAEPVQAALKEVRDTLRSWGASENTLEHQVGCALCDLMLSCNTADIATVTEDQLRALVAEYPKGERRSGLYKVSRVLAHKGIIARPLKVNDSLRGHWQHTLDSVPAEWLDWVQRWRRLSTHEPGTVRSMFAAILVAGRWVAEKFPDAIAPDAWTRDMAAEYVADTLAAVHGQWAPNNRNRYRWGQPLSARGKAQRMDCLRGFFCDLIEWEWIKARFDPRRVLSLPLSIRAQIAPNPRIIDEVAWAKLMAAGLTLNVEDVKEYGTPAGRDAAGSRRLFYPIEMVRALGGGVAVRRVPGG